MISRHRKVILPRPELNLTAMMDLVLNMITFFVLIFNVTTASLPALQVPVPDGSQARSVASEDRLTVSVLGDEDPAEAASGAARTVVVGATRIPANDLGRLAEELEKVMRPGVSVDLRADGRLRSDQVDPVLAAITGAGAGKINIVARIQH